ncbi:MAG: tRNA-dihydrouridine synthase [Campylobacter sp.]|nr:tRNA-dihydrouridine synthase [Campylobacter sp.]
MKLLEPFKFGGLTAKNRAVMAPMCMYMADDDGKPTKFHQIHYATRAIGGVGTIIVEATAVEARGRISDCDLGLWDESQVVSHQKLTKAVKKFGALVGVQIAHAGRKSECKKTQCVAPSAIKFSDNYNKPKALSVDEIYSVKDAFVRAGKLAMQSGYDFVEIHAAHGYLLHEFLSPLTNLRDDEFGRDFFGRTKLLFDIVNELKNLKIPFGVRISADEWEKDGFDIKSSKILSAWLEKLGAIYIHASAGGNHPRPSLMPEIKLFYQCGYAKEIKSVVNIPVIAVGLINSPEDGELTLTKNECDMVAYGRELLRNPNMLQYSLAKFKKDELFKPYERAF